MKVNFSKLSEIQKIAITLFLVCILVFSGGILTGKFLFATSSASTLLNYYLHQSTAPYQYMIVTNNNGGYFAINGTDGSWVTSWASTNLTQTEQDAVKAKTGNSTIILNQLQWEPAIEIPIGVLVWANYGGKLPTLWDSTGEISLVGAAGPRGPTGATGPQGATGATGATGPQGIQGAAGTNGTIGATWWYGSIIPSSETGNDGDLYINTANGYVYAKISGTWTYQTNLTGSQGIQGIQGVQGVAGAIAVVIQPYSYLIYYNSTNREYMVQNGTNGAIINSWSSTVDASSVIQDCVSAINSSGHTGIIDFAQGGFYPADNLNITGGVTFSGAGAVSSATTTSATILQDGPNNLMNFNQATTDFAFTMKDITLQGDYHTYSTGSGLYITPKGSGALNDVFLQRVFMLYFPAYAIYTTTTWGWMISNSIFEYNCVNATSDYAIYFASLGSNQADLGYSKILTNYGGGIYSKSATMIITENQIGGNIGYGAYLNNGFITFDSNQVYSNTLGGIYVASSYDTISNNEIDSNPGGGIFLTGYAGEIVGNTLYQNGGSQIVATGTDTTIASNSINGGLGQGLTINASSCTIENNVLDGNGNLSIIQALLNGANCTVSGNVFDGSGISGGGLEIIGVPSQTGNMVTNNIFEKNVGTDFSFNNNAIYLDRCYAPTTIRDNSGLNLLSASPKLFWINGVGYIQAYGKDLFYGVGNATSTWITGQTYTVTGFDVNVYLVGGGSNDTVSINGITIVSTAQITTLSIPAPVGTTITITCNSMPMIAIVPVPQ